MAYKYYLNNLSETQKYIISQREETDKLLRKSRENSIVNTDINFRKYEKNLKVEEEKQREVVIKKIRRIL